MSTTSENLLDNIAKTYVKLVLSVGLYDADYVDAYYGHAELKEEVKKEKLSLEEIKTAAESLLEILEGINISGEIEIIRLRYQYLKKQISALLAHASSLAGKRLSFDEEAVAYYDINPPKYSERFFQEIINELDILLPGKGTIPERFEKYHKYFVIPKNNLENVFNTAISECRIRTKNNIELPSAESFHLEYVNNKPWSGYNWYKGNCESLIQINTDLPIFIERAIDLASHEGYPGHHVYNCLLETELVHKRGWIEFTVYALFSPQSLIAEGTANYGIEVVLPGKERLEFEQNILFPAAGIDKNQAEKYYEILNVVSKLNYAENEAARNYIDKIFSHDDAIQWLNQYALMTPERAKQRVQFYDKYHSYVINYNVGKDLVKQYIEKRIKNNPDPKRQWEEFKQLISSPITASNLKQHTII